MHFHFSFYSSILLIFVSQGFLFSILLLIKGFSNNRQDSKWLSAFVFLCTLYILPFMLGFAGWYSVQPYRDILFYLPLQQTLLIGPVVYFFTQSLLNPRFKFTKQQWIHFIPAIVYLLFSIIVFVTDYFILKSYFFYANGRDKDFDTWYQLVGFFSLLTYAILSIRYYLLYQKFIYQFISFADQTAMKWVRNCLIIFIIMLFIQFVFFILFPNWGSFLQKWWYYFAFASLLYYIGLNGYTNNIKGVSPFFILKLPHTSLIQLPDVSPITFSEKYIDFNQEHDTEDTSLKESTNQVLYADEQIAVWRTKLEHVLVNEALFKNPELTLLHLAQVLNTHPTLISKMVNKGFNLNFNDWVNSYRIKAVIEKLTEKAYEKQTLLGISIDCGFNSKTSFNRSFRKFTGLSPKEFIQNLGSNHDLERQ